MRHIWVDVRIGSEDCSKITEVRALVDTGATLTIILRSLAIDLGLRVTGKSRVETGVGVIELDRSRAYIEVMGRGGIIPVLISDIIDKVLIGVTTLEILELEVDPITGELKERALLLYSLSESGC
ncbi:MAG: aspartyl protease family protein [Sulfolobales archaeon]